MLKEILGLEPTEIGSNTYTPAPTIEKMLKKSKSGYKSVDYDSVYQGDKKILVLCTEQDHLETRNGKLFITGNHPVEIFVPLLHLKKAGFAVDFATPTGAAVKFEYWAMPKDDELINALMDEEKDKLEKPMTIADALSKIDDYIVLFIPGGHGAVLGLPFDENAGKLIIQAKNSGLYIVSLCHGPAVFLSAAIGKEAGDDFVFKGYAIAAFPDRLDKQLPHLGYLPGEMPWYFGKRLESLGMDIVNHLATGKTHVDRKLITGDGPMAANKLGQITTETLLKALT